MIKPHGNVLKTKVLDNISKETCEKNYIFWKEKIGASELEEKELTSVTNLVESILPAHTFSYKKNGVMLLQSIFGYDVSQNTFNNDMKGILAKKFRDRSLKFGHMKTSDKLGHDEFVFAYLGIHNPYHRKKDDLPIRPFGIFIKKDVEEFAYCHGTPADVAEENELIDRSNLDKYYLLPSDLRKLKAAEILSDSEIEDFEYYLGSPDPEKWHYNNDYGKNLFKRTGEMRYYRSIGSDDIKAILWPFFTDIVYNGEPYMDENLDMYNAFKKAFPDIDVIKYSHDDSDQLDWEMRLIESSYYTTKFYTENGIFPLDAKLAIDLYKNHT